MKRKRKPKKKVPPRQQYKPKKKTVEAVTKQLLALVEGALGVAHPFAKEFAETHAALPHRQFWKRWLALPEVRAHVATLTMLPTQRGVDLLRALLSQTHPAPQRIDVKNEDVRPVQIFLGGNGNKTIELGYQPRGYLGPAPSGNGDDAPVMVQSDAGECG